MIDSKQLSDRALQAAMSFKAHYPQAFADLMDGIGQAAQSAAVALAAERDEISLRQGQGAVQALLDTAEILTDARNILERRGNR